MSEPANNETELLDRRGTICDRWMLTVAYCYLAIPSLIFVLGWLRWEIGIPAAIVLVIAGIWCVRAETPVSSTFLVATPARRQDLLAVLVLVVLWFVLSGIGGYTFQNPDHHWRNVMFRDLVYGQWPLIAAAPPHFPGIAKAGRPVAFVYYLGHWLPAALIGKLLGFHAAGHFLFVWSLLGGMLAYYFFFRFLRTVTFGLGVLFLAFSGLDIAGVLLMRLFFHSALPEFGEHIEGWAAYFQYSAITTTLYWVFNQAICVWVIVMLLFNQRRPGNLGFLFAMSFICAPYAAIGLLPIVLCQGYQLSTQQPRPHWYTFRGLAPLLLMGLICGAYYLANNQQASSGLGSGLFFHLFPFSLRTVVCYLLFCLLEYGVFLLFLSPAYRREPLFVVTGVALTLIPLYHSGINNDFVMRASIPLLLVVMVYLARYLSRPATEQHHPTRIALLILLVIGAYTPASEIIRSVVNTCQGVTVADKFHSYQDQRPAPLMLEIPTEFSLFFGSDISHAFFFRYLARK